MAFYINVPLSADGIADTKGKVEKVELRAHATELIYGDATYLQVVAQERWPDCVWRIEHVRTGRYVVRGQPKLQETANA